MNIRSSRMVIRGWIIVFWLMVLGIFLYSPLVLRWFPSSQTLTILIWPTMLDAEQLAHFEKETGIRVYVSYYESNDELLRKLRMTRGEGYDLIIAADSSIDALRSEKIFQKIDASKLSFFNQLRPAFMGHYFDPHNEFSIPYYCGVYGLGINKEYFGNQLPEISWDLLFKPQPFKVTMTDDPRKALLLAGRYMYGSIDDLVHEEKIAAIAQLLAEQKKWVELYSDIRGEELLAAQTCPVALTLSSDLWRIGREYRNLIFAVPEAGSFMIIDSCVIPAVSKKQDQVYQLLNFMYRPEIIRYHALKYGFCPPVMNVSVEGTDIFCPTVEQMKKLDFFRNVLPKNLIDTLWVSVMAE